MEKSELDNNVYKFLGEMKKSQSVEKKKEIEVITPVRYEMI